MKISTPIRQQKPGFSAPRPGAQDSLSHLTFSVVAVVLMASVYLAYSPALGFQFILDDHQFIGDPRLQSSGHVWEYFTSWVWAQFAGGPLSFYRPLFLLWLRVNFLLSEMSSWGWHFLSVTKHVSAAILLGLLVWKLLRDRVAALIASTLFALHPAQTESVAWITVPDPLMAAAMLGSVLLYMRYADGHSDKDPPHVKKAGQKARKVVRNDAASRPSLAWLVASAVACLAALLAKETAIVLPAVLFAMALLMHKGESPGLSPRLVRAFRATLPFLAATVVYILLRLNALGGGFVTSTQHLPWSTELLSLPATLWFYVKVLLWPVQPRAFTDPTQVDRFSLNGVLLPGFAVCCAGAILVGALVWGWKKARRDLSPREAAGVELALVLGTLLLALPILPALNLNALRPGDSLHGRYAYVSSAGLMLLLATGWHLARQWRTVLLFSGGVVAVAFGALTMIQESAWKDNLAVFTVAHQYAPHNSFVAQNLARAHIQAAIELSEAGRCSDAVPVFEQATQQYPEDWVAWAALGNCLAQLNDLSRAEQTLRRAAELAHKPQVTERWQQVRTMMEGRPSAPQE
ncbi:MAG TPA: tetratricopeptide repeat protein [Bryobacteraceae bacterium]|nr:tetratricopeptide repeat protein [Bryobacteraceae bacterium]